MDKDNSISVDDLLAGITGALQPLPTPGERLRQLRQRTGLSVDELRVSASELLGREKPLSASAVRNQENGTNGIPADVAEAYAKILSSSPAYILFGAHYAANSAREAFLVGEISADWRTFDPSLIEVLGSDGVVMCSLPGFDELDNVLAFRVADNSLSPEYQRDDIVFAGLSSKIGLKSGDHIIVLTRRKKPGPAEMCLKQLHVRDGSIEVADLATGDASKFKTGGDEGAPATIPWVIIGLQRVRTSKPGPLIRNL